MRFIKVIGLADDTYGVSSTNGQVTGDDEVDDYGSGRGICCGKDWRAFDTREKERRKKELESRIGPEW
jgi:hypothetical protein